MEPGASSEPSWPPSGATGLRLPTCWPSPLGCGVVRCWGCAGGTSISSRAAWRSNNARPGQLQAVVRSAEDRAQPTDDLSRSRDARSPVQPPHQTTSRKGGGSAIYHDQDLVFAKADGSPINPDYFSQCFDRTVAKLPVPPDSPARSSPHPRHARFTSRCSGQDHVRTPGPCQRWLHPGRLHPRPTWPRPGRREPGGWPHT